VLALCLLGSLGLPPKASPQEGAAPGSAAILLDVRGAIGPATAAYIRRGLEAAAARGGRIVVLRMDTPGGLDASMREIVRDMLASRLPVVAYVAPGGARAASAGTYILYASHLAAMAPATNLGAATPVQLGGGRSPGERDREEDRRRDGSAPRDPRERKAVNDAVAYIRGLAELQGRNADWAESAVREATSLPASAALEQRVIEIVAADTADLLRQANGRSVRLAGETATLDTAGLAIVGMEPDWRTRLLGVITNPNVAYMLLLVGIYGIVFEFTAPGTFFPGVTGAIALIVGLYALSLLPISAAGAALLLLGFALLVAEAFLPSFGVIGIGGVVAFAIGSILLFEEEVPGFTLSLPVVLTATAASTALLAVILGAVIRAHRRRVVSGAPAMIGESALVLRWSHEGGEVRLLGEHWKARSDAPLTPGDRVRVIGRTGLVLLVEPVKPPPP
jgi:membrane-bound serine protease (ClpP class)